MNTKYTFTTLRPDFAPVERDTFKEAFVDMFNWVHQQSVLTVMEIETAIWIAVSCDPNCPLYIYEANNLAHEQGILTTDGKLA